MRLFSCLTISIIATLLISSAYAQNTNIQTDGVIVRTDGNDTLVQVPGVNIQANDAPVTTRTYVKAQASGQSFVNSSLQNMNFSQRSLVGTDFSNASLTNLNFEGSDLRNAVFANVSCTNCNFRGANLSGADFSNASLENNDLRGAIVTNAIFRNANFSGSKVHGVDFSRSDVSNASFDNADYVTVYTVTTTTAPSVASTTIVQQLTKPAAPGKYHQTPNIDLAIHFATNSDTLESDAWTQLSELSKALNSEALKNASILIEGHTDSVGKDDYNMDLSYRRAAKVMQTLSKQLGVDVSRLSIKGYGETRPVTTNDTETGRSQNRRVTIVNLSAN